jgi:hypothetical protein
MAALSRLLCALVTLALAFVKQQIIVGGMMIVGGLTWIAILSTFNLAVQTAVPRWVQARALGFYLLVFQGGMAIASAAWGALSDLAGNSGALAFATLGLVVGTGISSRWDLKGSASLDLASRLVAPDPR